MSRSKSANRIFDDYFLKVAIRADRLFAALMLFQWLAGILVAVYVSPVTWRGTIPSTHIHVWSAVIIGGILSSLPIGLVLTRPGRPLNRYVIACAQMMWSALLIHLSGGRIETHFHVFGSLAFLAFYRDWRVLIPAMVVVSIDHFTRAVLWPQSVFGVFGVAPWRALEHACWAIFESVILAFSCRWGVSELKTISDQRAEIELQVDELRAQNEEIEQFVYIASHDLQEPLRSMRSMVDVLSESYAAQLPPQADEVVQFIESSATRMSDLVRGLLDYSRIGRSPERGSVDLTVIAREAIDDLAVQAEAAGATITCDELPIADGNAVELRLIFQNLVGNAMKFRGVDMPLIHVHADRIDDGWKVMITDNGIGIPEESHGKVFQIFQRLHRADEIPGTGIGLAHVKKIVDAHGWLISIEPPPLSTGTTFSIHIPEISCRQPTG